MKQINLPGIIILLLFLSCGQPHQTAAQQHAADSVKLKKEVKSEILRLNHKGRQHNNAGNKQASLAHHQQALEKAKKHGLYEEQARSLIGVANVLKTDNADQSVLHLKNALAISQQIGHDKLSSEIYSSLSEIYRQQSRYELALHALEEHHRLTDSLLNADKASKIAVIHKTYQRNAGLIIAVAIFIILLILIFYFYKSSQTNNKLRAANQVKDRLFTIIGHDLRNPIGSITDLLALMETDELTADEQRFMISEMRKQGDSSLEILNALLKWGATQLNGVSINPSTFNTKELIAKNLSALNGQANDKHLLITDRSEHDIQLYGDPDHFDFIIRNLVSNAIKFSTEAGRIEINSNTSLIPGETVFSVRDYGKGISPAQQELFKTATLDVSYGTKGEKGTGIGLMLSKEFTKANHGKIWMESEEGRGTTFFFYFKNHR